ncbi:MAG: Gfo/Idh/MocA family oxidoreductase [Acidobacteriota bacterium]|nr:Gfo/Idh/MocA family oxidoreductase [Acidobacteriota bacterium]
MRALTQSWPTPSCPRPIVMLGCGGIAQAAHLPAYTRLHFPVAGLFDVRPAAARAAAAAFGVGRVYDSLADACAAPGVVFDVAVPGDRTLEVLERLPPGATVLMQKPMGADLAQAAGIRACVRARGLTAAVNLQLRFSPGVLALRDLIDRGALGALVDVDVRVVIDQPWHEWSFLKGVPRLELPYHSIHYLDAIRWIAGEPRGVYCRAASHPELPAFRDTRSSIILDYGDRIRCSLVLNHTHRYGPEHHASQLLVEGTSGAARLTWGVNLAYPAGPPDTMEVALRRGEWQPIPLRGSWFTEAFEGPMSNLQRFAAGEDAHLVGSVDDAMKTMALVEACYMSSDRGGTPVPGTD